MEGDIGVPYGALRPVVAIDIQHHDLRNVRMTGGYRIDMQYAEFGGKIPLTFGRKALSMEDQELVFP